MSEEADIGDVLSDVQVETPVAQPPEPASLRNNLGDTRREVNDDPSQVRDTAGKGDEPAATRPEWLPEKFKSPEDLVKAYNELGGKLREKNDPPEAYELTLPDGVSGLTDDDAAAFKQMGLTNDQAQKLVDYFHANVVPEIQNIRAGVEKERLAAAWNMQGVESHEFSQRLVEVKSWAARNLPEAAVAEMAKTANGVNALYKMMQSGMDAKNIQPAQAHRLDKAQLQELMNDPRYVNRDPDYMAHVQRKFQETYDR